MERNQVFSRFQKLQRLSAKERWLLVQALVLLPLTLCGVHILSVSRWQHLLVRLARLRNISGPDLNSLRDEKATIQDAHEVARIVDIAARRGLYQANCLQQALVLEFLLRRDHIDSEIRFGARKEDGQLKAHAWVECRGIALNEERDVSLNFAPFEAGAAAEQSETC